VKFNIVRTAATAALISVVATTPVWADSPTLPASPSATPRTGTSSVPPQLGAAERESYRAVFSAIRGARWTDAAARLDAMPDGLLTPLARAELYLAKDSPRVDLEPLVALIVGSPDLPEAPQLAALAKKRGADMLPELPMQPARRSARARAPMPAMRPPPHSARRSCR
jgi:soluble lytic murein transglycosylase